MLNQLTIKKNVLLRLNFKKNDLFRLTIYRTIFWIGYIAILITTLIPINRFSLNKISLGPEAFHIRLDHFLHFTVYFLICTYYLTGAKKGLFLFASDPFRKFVLLILFLSICTELIQLWVPERAFNVFDLISNVAGAWIGVVIIRMAQRRSGAEAQRH